MNLNEQIAVSHFELVGGQAAVDQIVDSFYHHMATLPQAATILALHPPDLSGTKALLKKYLAERDAWMACMQAALEEVIGSRRLRDLLLQQLFKVADWMRNADASL